VNLLESVSIVSPPNELRGQLTHALDGRYQPLRPSELVAVVRELAAGLNMRGIDYVLGFPEEGVVPAFAFAHLVGRPLVLSTRFVLEGSGTISFDEPHSGLGRTHYIQGLRADDRVVIIEDEVTTGRTLVNAVRALRQAGVRIDAAGALLAVDDAAMWRAMDDEHISLLVTSRLPGVYRRLLGVDAAP